MDFAWSPANPGMIGRSGVRQDPIILFGPNRMISSGGYRIQFSDPVGRCGVRLADPDPVRSSDHLACCEDGAFVPFIGRLHHGRTSECRR